MSASVSDALSAEVKNEIRSIGLACEKICSILCSYLEDVTLNDSLTDAMSKLANSLRIANIVEPLIACLVHVELLSEPNADENALSFAHSNALDAKDSYSQFLDAVDVSIEDDLEITQRFEIIEDALKRLEKLT